MESSRCDVAMETGKAAAESEVKAGAGQLAVPCLRDRWHKWSSNHQEYQKHNPFSNDQPTSEKHQRGQKGYGRPPEGSLTEHRGREAHTHVGREVCELCDIINAIGESRGDGSVAVQFGKLFERYVTISNKLVGVLLRARRHGLVHFQGEMLWQGRDDQVVITLLQEQYVRTP